jgi:hypothetical protein
LQYLQRFIDKSQDGVIYFIVGSNPQSSNMKKVNTKAFLESFSKLSTVEVGDRLITGTGKQRVVVQLAATVRHFR